MNQAYRLVWNAAQQCYLPAPETARGRGKQGGRAPVRSVALALAMLSGAASVQALPTGAELAQGALTVVQNSTSLTVNQSSQKAVINWQSFGIASNESVNFVQPSASAVALNRVMGNDPSVIFGKLSANGQVFLLNPNGVLFGKGAEVNVGGLVASTLHLTDADFSAGKRSFGGGSTASVINQGQIAASDGGYIALLGSQVSNRGTLQATLGTVVLAAGQRATLDFAGDKLIKVQVDQGAMQALADNQQLIQADGGQVFMSARAADQLVTAVVNNSGVIRARTLESRGGVISLIGDMQFGRVDVGGTLDASAPKGGNGGQIETSAAKVTLADDLRVTTAASNGQFGDWLIDPKDYTVAASGGDMTGAALSGSLAGTNVTLQSSAGSGSGAGNVNVNDAVNWSANTRLTLTASNDVNVNASITAQGTGAGLFINPNTANGGEAVTGSGRFKLGNGAAINLPNVSAGSATALVIGGTVYTVINSLGSAGDTSAQTLQGMAGNLVGNYALGSDINALATAGWNAGAGFAPIGVAGNGFGGSFEGLGHTVLGLSVNRPSSTYVGLFGSVEAGGALRNVGLLGAGVSGASVVGGLVGSNEGVIEHSFATGSVFAGSGSVTVGGLAGQNRGSVNNAYSTASVTGTTAIGGLIGNNDSGTVANSYATGNVVGNAGGFGAGGLVGQNTGVASSVSNSYATGNVSGSGNVGGLVGTNAGTVSTSYAAGTVVGSGSNVGGLVGRNTRTVSSSFWNSVNAAGVGSAGTGSTVTGSSGLTTAQMRQASSFVGFSFTTVAGGPGWVIVNGDGSLNNAGGASLGGTSPLLASEFANTVGNAHQLQLMALAPTDSFVLSRSINASGTGAGGHDVWDGKGFVSVGTSNAPFTGRLDGANQSIQGLVINAPTRSKVGLIGELGAGHVSNLGLYGGSVTGLANVGGVIGLASGGSVNNVYNASTVSGGANGDSVGGLVGSSALNHSISDSYASGNVSGSSRVGGLVGNSSGSTISHSYASGNVTGSVAAGGLVGSAFAGAISDSFWNSDLIAEGVGSGSEAGAFGLSTAQLRSSANFTSATAANGSANPGWDLASTWIQYDGNSAPLLRSFMTPLAVTANNAGKTYDRNVKSDFSVSYSSAPDARLLGTPGFEGAATTATQVGTYTLMPTGLYSNQQGYALSFVNGGLTISPASLSVLGSSAVNKVYNGNTEAAVVGGSLSGVVAGDTVTLTQAGVFANKNVANGIAVTANNTIAGASAANYVLVQPTGLSANITPKDVLVDGVILASNKVYDGTATAMLTGGSLSGVLNGDTVSLQRAGLFGSKNVGTGLAVTSTSTLAGAAAGNYSLVQPTGLTASISAKTLTVGNTTVAADKVYDGNASVVLSGGSFSGAVSGDALILSQAGTFADKNAGRGKSVTFTNTLTGQDAANYSLSAATGSVRADVSQRTLGVVASVTTNKVYDTTRNANLTGNLVGVLAGEQVALQGTFSDKKVGTAKLVKYGNNLTGDDAANYSLGVSSGSTTADITPATVVITGMTALSKVYNGKTKATLTGGGLTGVLGADTLRLKQTGEFVNKNAGLGVSVTSTSTISGSDAANYVFTQPTNLRADITPKTLRISGTRVASRDYDGSTAATISGGKLGGIITGDVVTLLQEGSFADKNAGLGKMVTFSNILTGPDALNYKPVSVIGTKKATIRPLLLEINNDDVVFYDKVFDGTTTATLESGSTLDGVIPGDSLALVQTGAFAIARPSEAARVNFISVLVGADKDNYKLTPKTGSTTAVIEAP